MRVVGTRCTYTRLEIFFNTSRGLLTSASLSTPCDGKCILLGYADADWGGCLDTRRSTSGYVFKVFGGVVAWRSKRQPTTALLTMEAKYMSSSGAAGQVIWLRQLLLDLGLSQVDEPTRVYNNNTASLSLSKNPINHDRAKTHRHYIPSSPR